MMQKTCIQQIYPFFTILIFLACASPEPGSRTVPVDQVEMEPRKIIRFDRELTRLYADSAHMLHQRWKQEYPAFYRDFVQHILGLGDPNDDRSIVQALENISVSEQFVTLRDSMRSQFLRLDGEEAQLTDAFRRVRFYFPDAPIPDQLIAFFSGFAVQVPVGEDYIGVGLDLFMGSEFPFYRQLVGQFPLYISRRFTPDHMVPRIVEAYIQSDLLTPLPSGAKFLDHMLQDGKKLFLMDLFLPEVSDSLKIGYTDRQLAWAEHFERAVWDYFVSEELLYQTDRSPLQTYFGEAPFTPGLGEQNESAPRVGQFIGWQMVRKYMQEHPDLPPSELIQLRNGQEFLEAARYRGR